MANRRALPRAILGTALLLLAGACWIPRFQADVAALSPALETVAVGSVLLAVAWIMAIDVIRREIDHEIALPAWLLVLALAESATLSAAFSLAVAAPVAAAAWEPRHPRYRLDPAMVAIPAIGACWLAGGWPIALATGLAICAVLAWRWRRASAPAVIGFGDTTVVMLAIALYGAPPLPIQAVFAAVLAAILCVLACLAVLRPGTRRAMVPGAPVILPPFAVIFLVQISGVVT